MPSKIVDVHPSMLRLLEAAQAATKDRAARDRVRDWADLTRVMNVSGGVMSNWKRRGLSKEGAIEADRLFACSTAWLLEGTPAPATKEAQTAPEPDVRALSADLERMLADLEDLTPDRQSKIIDMIHQEAELARAAAEHLARKRNPTMAAERPRRPSSTLRVQMGDGNPAQGVLPLTTVADPFTAEPDERERELYERIAGHERHPK